MQLSSQVTDFICRFWKKFISRTFIIDTMTVVDDRPMMCLYNSEFLSETQYSVTIDLFSAPKGAVYAPPYNLKQIEENYSKEVVDKLIQDPVHKWRAETGIELTHHEPDLWEQIRTYRNWTLMSPEQKKTSEEMSIKMFGQTNANHYRDLISEYNADDVVGSILMLVDEHEDKYCIGYVSEFGGGKLVINYLSSGSSRIMGETDTFTLKKGILKCMHDDTPIETTVGRFLLNVLLVELPFNGVFDYINVPGFDVSGLEKKISAALMNDKIMINQYKQYIDNIYFIGHFCELCVPTYSRASLTTSPDMAELKKKLLEKYKGRLNDPKVIAEIENTLIAADKAYLKNDISMRFYTPLGGKPFNIARKKMYLLVGGIEAFSKDSGKYDFIPTALDEGWTNQAIPSFANEIRKGSFNRGHETQLGGAQTKYIVRVFQDLCITEDDCHTSRGLLVDFAFQNPKDYNGRYILIHGKWTEITPELMQKITGNKYIMRSPMYCQCKSGLCKKCSGEVFSRLNVKHVAMFIVDISSTFTTMALKLMHGSKLELKDLGELNQYLV